MKFPSLAPPPFIPSIKPETTTSELFTVFNNLRPRPRAVHYSRRRIQRLILRTTLRGTRFSSSQQEGEHVLVQLAGLRSAKRLPMHCRLEIYPFVLTRAVICTYIRRRSTNLSSLNPRRKLAGMLRKIWKRVEEVKKKKTLRLSRFVARGICYLCRFDENTSSFFSLVLEDERLDRISCKFIRYFA